MNRIFITGDGHGEIDFTKFDTLQKTLEKDKKPLDSSDIVIGCGDAGIVWYGGKNRDEEKLLKRYAQKKATFLWVLGNHENYGRIYTDEFPVISLPLVNGEVRQVSDNVFFLLNSHTYTIAGKRFLVFGGGLSVDKAYRIPGRSWWPQEIPTDEEFHQLLEIAGHERFDYILTHAAPQSFVKKLFDKGNKINDPVSKMLEEILTVINYNAWICGHYHEDKVSPNLKLACLYNRIITLESVHQEISEGGILLENVD
ncbi:Ser/Thr protein phosphatase family protein [Treponema primitia ZAS-2]|uniref:Ser/Thr protein phosphatase family protein n=1 Tax=Treponema primitia (strain ATCC BAA-887 / DSM 12427 / ZAS-2) TaxID=545694 RepID=F5YLX2_TREPZ|nr:metallophosphoesterase [Treponema primitia]AEF87024.1 Ser/Thr protein phosphatase family protein [Treponema primitia ZAS-2]